MKLWMEIHLIVAETPPSPGTMSNQTLVTEFILQGFAEHPEYRVLLFSCFLFLYSGALTGHSAHLASLLLWPLPSSRASLLLPPALTTVAFYPSVHLPGTSAPAVPSAWNTAAPMFPSQPPPGATAPSDGGP
ncbi:hypothetical protein P7K49_014234 [Saguinus oedipus]|uniref:Uncharacterized protein n=1 Tax=Saguinus oedipus TaxID=9490 RepID=A0ABQ9VI91_SAGOE|nr:hypothetical protein P7K49_014234 [Saguinus oedipus]